MEKKKLYLFLFFALFMLIVGDLEAQRILGGPKRHVLRKGKYLFRNDPTFLVKCYRRVKEISFQCRYPFYPCRSSLGEECLVGSGLFFHFEYERSDVDFLKLGLMNVSWDRFPSAFVLDYQYAPLAKIHGVELKVHQYFLPINRVYLFALGVSLDSEFRGAKLLCNFKPYLGLTLPIRALSQLQFSYGYNIPLAGANSTFNSFFVDWKIPLLFN